MKYVVEKYLDQVKEKSDKEAGAPANFFWQDAPSKYAHVFDTRDEAHAFIRDRAKALVKSTRIAHERAILRQKKCEKKFPISASALLAAIGCGALLSCALGVLR